VRDPKLLEAKRKKLNSLIIIDVHARDIIDRFVRDSILDAREFDWESQLRFYWNREKDDMSVQQCTGEFRYLYEYLGLDTRLIITPLTDRCYMTLTQALTFKLGGSPAGPAGTGKTETVKDLAKALGIACVVTNCGEGLDYKAMGSIFSGLVQTGFWGCFDEFNRIDVEVLSVVSSQLMTIQTALVQERTRFEFLGKEINLKSCVGFFITMNPGYAGRTELPDNLKALFRPVTMIVPDLEQICEIMLFSEGFLQARKLAKKMTVLYKLAREQLSKQNHYDFGLRALKSVLVMAGALKRDSPDLGEESVLMRALRDMNLPKFVFEDVPLFKGLISDLFPGLDLPRTTHKGLKAAVVEDLELNGYKHDKPALFELQADKVMQLYETMITRHCTMIVGGTTGGKSVVLKTLANAQLKAFKTKTLLYTMNPKAINVSELYGVLDPATRDWTDGLLSSVFREIAQPLKPDQSEARYIVFDGDVDAVWIENMNSVMDDNKLLTLANGDRIRLEDHCKLLFEVGSLEQASPATVSRCGMVYVSPLNLGHYPYYYRWVQQRFAAQQADERQVELLMTMLDKYVDPCIEYALEGKRDGQLTKEGALPAVITCTAVALVRQLCGLFTSLMPLLPTSVEVGERKDGAVGDEEERKDSRPAQKIGRQPLQKDGEVMESLFIWCTVWSIGAVLKEQARFKFDQFVKGLSGRQQLQSAGKSHVPENPIYEYIFGPILDSGDSSEAPPAPTWQPWKVPAYVPPNPFKFSQVLVPTVDTVRYTYVLDSLMNVKLPVLLVGDSGTAKTVTISNYLRELDYNRFTSLTVNFSSRTTSRDVQSSIETSVEKRTGVIYGPPLNKQMIIFIDDLNMPRVDKYGTQQPIALLKFLVETGSMYDRGGIDGNNTDRLKLKKYMDVSYLAAMAPPGGGRSEVDPRFVSQFGVLGVTFPSDESLEMIYSSIIKRHLSGAGFKDELREVGRRMSEITITLYRQLVEKLPPTPAKFHYVFNLRDLSRVFEGLLMSRPEKFDTGAKLVRLWRNECLRVFYDRLISVEDKKLVGERIIPSLLKETYQKYYSVAMQDPILFGNFRTAHKADENKYEDMDHHSTLRPIVEELRNSYNDDADGGQTLPLVLFEDALEHIVRIMRILAMPRGHALLVGVGGSGKQSLTKLAAYIAKYKVFSISLTRSYGLEDFKEELKKIIYPAWSRKGSDSGINVIYNKK